MTWGRSAERAARGVRAAGALLCVVALLHGSTVAAEIDGPFKSGIDAYQSGDYVAAFKAWLPLAHSGDPAAQRNLGHLYRMGLGVGQDFSKAVEWYRRAAESGLARAQANLGNAYLRGQGVARNYRKAKTWFERAAAQGHTISQYNLALMYESGLGMVADDAEALKWFYLASKGGHGKALRKLAQLISQNAPAELASLIVGDARTTEVAAASAAVPGAASAAARTASATPGDHAAPAETAPNNRG